MIFIFDKLIDFIILSRKMEAKNPAFRINVNIMQIIENNLQDRYQPYQEKQTIGQNSHQHQNQRNSLRNRMNHSPCKLTSKDRW